MSTGATEAGWHSQDAAWRCAKEAQFRDVRRIRTPEKETPEALALGLCFHAARDCWFTLGFHTDEATHRAIREAIEREAEEQRLPVGFKAQERALALITDYIDWWSPRAKPTPVRTEYKIGPAALTKKLPDDLKHLASFLKRTARLDDVSYYPEGNGALWIGECKTTGETLSGAARRYELHGQTLLQPALWAVAPQGQKKLGKVAGVMLDLVQKGDTKEAPKFARVPLPVNDYAIEWFIKDQLRTLHERSGISWDTDVKRNVTACTRSYGKGNSDCPFKQLCMYGQTASVKFLFEDGQSLMSWRPSEGQTVPPWK